MACTALSIPQDETVPRDENPNGQRTAATAKVYLAFEEMIRPVAVEVSMTPVTAIGLCPWRLSSSFKI